MYRQECIRGAFISGLSSSTIRQRLLENNNITLDEAFRQARTLELEEKQSADYTTYEQPLAAMNHVDENENEDLLAVTRKTKYNNYNDNNRGERSYNDNNRGETCFFCRRNRHPRAKCPAKESNCNNCGTKGHLSIACKSKNKETKSSPAITMPTLATTTSTNKTSKINRDITYVKSVINEKEVNTMIDSGSMGSFIGLKTAQRLGLFIIPSSESIELADCTLLDTIGEVVVGITIGGKLYKCLVLCVMNKLVTQVIMGKDFLRKHKKVTFQFNGNEDPITFAATSKSKTLSDGKYLSLDSGTTKSTMSVPPANLFSNLTSNCKPVACKSRRYNDNDKQFTRKEKNAWLADGAIVPSKSPWRAQPIITRDDDKNHRRRMAIDYSQTINLFTEHIYNN